MEEPSLISIFCLFCIAGSGQTGGDICQHYCLPARPCVPQEISGQGSCSMCSTSSSSPTLAAPQPRTPSAPASPPRSARLWGELPQAAAPVASGPAAVSLLAAAAPSVLTTPTSVAPVSLGL